MYYVICMCRRLAVYSRETVSTGREQARLERDQPDKDVYYVHRPDVCVNSSTSESKPRKGCYLPYDQKGERHERSERCNLESSK